MTIHVESTSDTKEQVQAAIGGQKAPVKEEKSEAAPAKAEEQAETADESEASEKEPEETDEGESKDEPKEKPLKGVEKRISKLVKQRDAARQEAEALKAEKAKAIPEVKAKPEPSSDKPKAEAYDSHEEFIEALTDWKLADREAKAEAAKKEAEVKTQRQKAVDSYNSKLETVQEKYPDYEDVIEESEIEAPGHILAALFESENGPELTYLLAKNEEELKRISKLSPASALLELGKFEAKHINGAPEESPEPKLTKAPAPIKPVGSKGSSGSKKNPDEMDFQEFKRWRAKQA